MDDDNRTFLAALVAFLVVMVIGVSAEAWMAHTETITAMERGYIQVVDKDTHKLTWVKNEEPVNAKADAE